VDNPRTPIIYFLKKLHKNPISVRPIVSNVNSPTCQLSAFMDILLKPIVNRYDHILKNSVQVINELEASTFPSNSILVTADVSSLYPSIPIDESISVILDFIRNYNDPKYPPIIVIENILSFVLKYNCFNFADLFFLQVRGIAMGTKMAPNYANLFMAYFEDKFIFNYPSQPVYYRRYIDDILIIWTSSVDELTNFQTHVNNVHSTIKFTFETSTNAIQYLDLLITLEGDKCYVKPFFKKTNTFSYVMGNSHHPRSTFKGIVTGENTRILRNCSKQEDYQQTMTSLKDKFNERKFPSHLLNGPFIPFEQRKDLLQQNQQGSKDKNYITFVCLYDTQVQFKDVLKENWDIWATEDSTRANLLKKQVRITYKHPPNLSQRIVRAKLEDNVNTNIAIFSVPSLRMPQFPAKNISCRDPQCGLCRQLSSKSTYYSYQTKSCYVIKDVYSCDTRQGIYLLDCSICNKQYVGETGTTVRSRIKHHRNAARSNLNRPIYQHLTKHQKGFEVFSITIIDKVPDLQERKVKEMYYINLLKTKLPFGLNVISKK